MVKGTAKNNKSGNTVKPMGKLSKTMKQKRQSKKPFRWQDESRNSNYNKSGKEDSYDRSSGHDRNNFYGNGCCNTNRGIDEEEYEKNSPYINQQTQEDIDFINDEETEETSDTESEEEYNSDSDDDYVSD